MKLTSTAIAQGQPIPKRHSGDGENLSPALAWDEPPAGTRQFALLCDDPDAPTPQPWVHWVIAGLSPALRGLPEGLPRQGTLKAPLAAVQGMNSWTSDNLGYRGPSPPHGHGTHHYSFRLYALDRELALPPGADKAALLNAIRGHVLAEAVLMGTYER